MDSTSLILLPFVSCEQLLEFRFELGAAFQRGLQPDRGPILVPGIVTEPTHGPIMFVDILVRGR